ncbi:MAG: hypothetical protein RBU37_26830, partial [Myxococcota bacterium]|nr:hypothetical protein [Myxococcota bacterium]
RMFLSFSLLECFRHFLSIGRLACFPYFLSIGRLPCFPYFLSIGRLVCSVSVPKLSCQQTPGSPLPAGASRELPKFSRQRR